MLSHCHFQQSGQEGLIEQLIFRGKGVPGGGHSKCKGPEVSMNFSEEWTVCVLEWGGSWKFKR